MTNPLQSQRSIFDMPAFGIEPKPTPQKFTPRDYQQKAIDAALYYFEDKLDRSKGIIVAPTGSGKSIIVAEIARRLKDPTIIFQPSKEILDQNYAKIKSYGYRDCSIFSASAGQKNISHLTFATIGSAYNQIERFRHFKNIIIDECHLSGQGGRYDAFLEKIGDKAIGLTATPYRLASYQNFQTGENESMLKFLTRTRPRIFSKILHYTQTKELFDRGYLSPMEYEVVPGFNQDELRPNSTGADYDDRSLMQYFEKIRFSNRLLETVEELKMRGRKNILVFTRFIREADVLVRKLGPDAALVTGDTEPKLRADILARFRSGKIKVIANAMVLTIGFDFPELETVVIARPTRSLALYYQMLGRGTRPHPSKKFCLVVDMCDNYDRFGKIEDLKLTRPHPGSEQWYYESNGRQLTNVPLSDIGRQAGSSATRPKFNPHFMGR